jgi:hypothetical protein
MAGVVRLRDNFNPAARIYCSIWSRIHPDSNHASQLNQYTSVYPCRLSGQTDHRVTLSVAKTVYWYCMSHFLSVITNHTSPVLPSLILNGRSQMQEGKNWILPKEMSANRFFWDSLAGNLVKTLMSLYWTERKERGYGLKTLACVRVVKCAHHFFQSSLQSHSLNDTR